MMPRLLLWSVLILPLLAPGTRTAAVADEERDLAESLQQALQIERELVETCERVRRASVSVRHERLLPRNRDGTPAEDASLQLVGVGSGVLVERKGRPWVITNVHVIVGADRVQVVTHDGEIHPTEVHDTIRQYDIALLAFPRTPRGLQPVRIDPRASRRLEVGAWVVATGNPFFLALDGRSVTTLGVVSGKDRILGGDFLYGNAIQHDAEVNPGNSGGPLWNLRGELVGINGKIATRFQIPGAGPANTGASFSIPIHQVNAFLMAMIDQGTDAQAGFLGLVVETATDERGAPGGALVKEVHKRSPAGRGRGALETGDVITTMFFMQEWHRIRTASDVTNLLSLAREGAFLKIRYRRGRRSYTWSGRLTREE